MLEAELYTGGLTMTRFDSRLVYEQLVRTVNVDVPVTGTIPAGSQRSWVSQWYDMEIIKSTVRADVLVPGSTFFPDVTNGRFDVPCRFVYDSVDFLSCVPFIEVSGGRWRCSVLVLNNYNQPIQSPNRTFSFVAREYLPPIR